MQFQILLGMEFPISSWAQMYIIKLPQNVVWSLITEGTLMLNQVLGTTQPTPEKYGIIVEGQTV